MKCEVGNCIGGGGKDGLLCFMTSVGCLEKETKGFFH